MFYLTESAQDTATGSIRALDSQTGQPTLEHTSTKPSVTASGVAAPPQGNGLAAVYSPGPIPTGATPSVNTIAVVQLSTGNMLWQHDVTGPSEIPVTIVGDLVVVPEYSVTTNTLTPMLVAYTLQTGNRTWVLHLRSGLNAPFFPKTRQPACSHSLLPMERGRSAFRADRRDPRRAPRL